MLWINIPTSPANCGYDLMFPYLVLLLHPQKLIQVREIECSPISFTPMSCCASKQIDCFSRYACTFAISIDHKITETYYKSLNKFGDL